MKKDKYVLVTRDFHSLREACSFISELGWRFKGCWEKENKYSVSYQMKKEDWNLLSDEEKEKYYNVYED